MYRILAAGLVCALQVAAAAAQVPSGTPAKVPNGFLPGQATFCSTDGGVTWAPCAGGGGSAGTANSISGATYVAIAGGSGYSTGDLIDRIVVSDPSSGTVSSTYWVNITTGAKLAAAPAAANLTPFAATAARDTNGDLRVPTVTLTPFYVALTANTSTELLAASSARIGYELQCTGTAAVAISRTHATLTSATPSAGGADMVIPTGTTPVYIPAYVSGLGLTAYTGTAQACWGVSYARQ